MPLWQIYHPEGAYSAEDKKSFSERITKLYQNIPIPGFYVVVMFHPLPADSFYVGGEPQTRFVRFRIDQMARTLNGTTARSWWMRRVEEVIKPYVSDRGFESEVQIAEPPSDLWTMNGLVPPPPESYAEKRWIDENRTSAYSEDEKMPIRRRAS